MKIGRWELHWHWTEWVRPDWDRYKHKHRMYDWILDVGPFQLARQAKK